MLLALLATVVTATPSTGQPVLVDFGAKGSISVPLPKRTDAADPQLLVSPTLMSPRGDAAAIQFCWNISTMSPLMCQVNLVRPGGQILNLKGGAVGPMLWTPDGRYLIGAGNNTVRLWNLVGGLRMHSPQPPNTQIGVRARTGRITRLWLERGFLCVAARAETFRNSGGNSVQQLSVTTRYALPVLKPLETVTKPVHESQEAPCHMPMTEP